MPLKNQRINLLNQEFSRSLRGYSPREVDDFIQDAVDTIARMSDERLRLMKKVQRLEKQLIAFAGTENSLQKALVASQQVSEEIKLQAQKEAMLIIEAAQTKAQRIAHHANVRLANVKDEIRQAQAVRAQFEVTVRSAIENHLQLLDMQAAKNADLTSPQLSLPLEKTPDQNND